MLSLDSNDWLSVVLQEAFRLFWYRGSLGLSFPGGRNHTCPGSGLASVVHPLQELGWFLCLLLHASGTRCFSSWGVWPGQATEPSPLHIPTSG